MSLKVSLSNQLTFSDSVLLRLKDDFRELVEVASGLQDQEYLSDRLETVQRNIIKVEKHLKNLSYHVDQAHNIARYLQEPGSVPNFFIDDLIQ